MIDMSESAPPSDDTGSDYDSEYSVDESYDYTGEECYSEDTSEEEVSESHSTVGTLSREDWQYCEQGARCVGGQWPPRRTEAPQVYAPDRGPPLLDFLFVITAFFAACFA